MNGHATIEYHGAALELSTFLAPLLPHNLPLKDWPTYCGAGKGPGDWLVPDRIEGAYIQVACFQHDIDWALSSGTREEYEQSNMRFLRNLRRLVRLQITDEDELSDALWNCEVYYIAVSSPVGFSCYEPTGTDPFTNPVVREKLRRLGLRNWGIS